MLSDKKPIRANPVIAITVGIRDTRLVKRNVLTIGTAKTKQVNSSNRKVDKYSLNGYSRCSIRSDKIPILKPSRIVFNLLSLFTLSRMLTGIPMVGSLMRAQKISNSASSSNSKLMHGKVLTSRFDITLRPLKTSLLLTPKNSLKML